MNVSRIRALRGPNLWSQRTAIEAVVSCNSAKCSLDKIPGFMARLNERLPGTALPQPVERHEAMTMAHVLEFVALNLQTRAGCPVSFSHTAQTAETGTYRVIVEYSEEAVGRLAFELAQTLCLAAIDAIPFDLAAALQRLRELDEDMRLGPSTGAIVHAAIARGIPYRRLTEGSMVQFGWGSQQRRIQASETDRTSAVAESIAQDKELTKMLLHAAGIPVPAGRPRRSW